MRRTAGFSLLEALFALAIAAMGLTAAFALQQQLVGGQRRFDATIERSELRQDALNIVRDLNPDETPEGQAALTADVSMNWTSEALTDPRTTRRLPTGAGTFSVTLYRVSVQVVDADGAELDNFTVERMGVSPVVVE